MNSNCKPRISKEWQPMKILSENSGNKYTIILLNQPFDEQVKEKVMKIWKSATLRVAVDGGTKYIYNITGNHQENYVPHLITGDFDSVELPVLEFYKKKGSQVVHTPDQDETDFTKSLRVSTTYLQQKKVCVSSFIVVCRNSGRMDHILANLNTLYLAKDIACLPVFLFSGDSLTWLLDEGRNSIHVPTSIHHLHCGLIPLGEPCENVTTTGLKWNLQHQKLQFGGLLSTSNTFDGSEVITVETDKKLLWTMGIP